MTERTALLTPDNPFTDDEILSVYADYLAEHGKPALVEINDNDLQDYARKNTRRDDFVCSSLHLPFGVVSSDDDVPTNTVRFYPKKDSSVFHDRPIRTEPNAVVVEAPDPAWSAPSSGDLATTVHTDKANLETLLDDFLLEANDANSPDSALRSRELSLAITNVEQALMWLQRVPVE